MSEPEQTASVWGWRGAASGIVQRMKHILESGEGGDILFAVGRHHGEEQLFHAHKFVLGLGSDVFEAMFHGEVPETAGKIELPDILPQSFGIMLKYLYTDVVEELSMENVVPTLYCAQKYGIPKLVDICAKYAIKKLDKSNCLTLLEAAVTLDAGNVVRECLAIVDTHCSELLQTQEFLQLKNESLRMIFSRDTLIANEEDVYKAAERWAMNGCQSNQLEPTAANYRRVLGDALFSIRFPLLNDEQLADGPVASGLLLNEESLKIFQFKRAAKKPGIPFASTPRSSDILFCDRRWILLENSETNFRTTRAKNIFLDSQGHLHLRISKQDGVWKGARIQSADALGFGRYEFHIDGLDRLRRYAFFALSSQAENEPGVVICCTKGVGSCTGFRFSVRPAYCLAPFAPDNAIFYKNVMPHTHTHTTHSFHRKPDSVSFASKDSRQQSSPADVVLSSWSYDFGPNISQEPQRVFISLLNNGDDRRRKVEEAEIIVRSFRFYPDE